MAEIDVMRGKPHSEEVRAQVIAALLQGQGVVEVATAYNLDKGLVSRWRASLPTEQLQLVASQKGERIEHLVFTYLSGNLEALHEQTKVAGDPDYIRKQPASDLAVLHGVMADKAIRILEAVHRAQTIRLASEAEQ